MVWGPTIISDSLSLNVKVILSPSFFLLFVCLQNSFLTYFTSHLWLLSFVWFSPSNISSFLSLYFLAVNKILSMYFARPFKSLLFYANEFLLSFYYFIQDLSVFYLRPWIFLSPDSMISVFILPMIEIVQNTH